MENIDTTLSKTGDAYGNKKANRMKSIFAYRKMSQAILSSANKMGVDVIRSESGIHLHFRENEIYA